MLFHDLIAIPPFNDVPAIRKEDSIGQLIFLATVNGLFVAIPLYLTLCAFFKASIQSWMLLLNLVFYTILTIGTICAWWIPYIFGSSASHKMHFYKF